MDSISAVMVLSLYSVLGLSFGCKTMTSPGSSGVAVYAEGTSCYTNGFTTCLEPQNAGWLVCNSSNQIVFCDSCNSDVANFPEKLQAEALASKATSGYYHDYAQNCQQASANPVPTASAAPVAAPAPAPAAQAPTGDTMIFGYNIHDVDQHHFYSERLGNDLAYKDPNTKTYVLHRAFAVNDRGSIDRAIALAQAKGDLLIIRLDYADGKSVPTEQGELNLLFAVADELLKKEGIAYVQVGNEPNLDYECQNTASHCQPSVYLPVIQRYKGHPKFISAPWGPTESQALSKPWEWALGVLSGNCPVNIGIHAYPALGNGDRAKTTAFQFIAMNVKYIWEAGCRNSNIFILEMNGNMGGDVNEWNAAIKAARTGIDWLNARLGNRIRAALLFTLGQEGTSDSQDQMSRFYLSVGDRAGALNTAVYCGRWANVPSDCIDTEIDADFDRAWRECVLDERPVGGMDFCPFN